MPESQPPGPRPAFVEDFDDDRNTVLSDTRVHARAGKDGSDSGYSSRTGTVDGDQHDPKSHSVPIERQRMPYGGVATVRRRESVHQQKPVRPTAPDPVRAPKDDKKKFCHPPGICWTCDKVGYHMTQEELDTLRSRLKREKSSTKEAPVPPREVPTPEAKDRHAENKLRRMSSHRESRPPMPQYPPSAMQPMQVPSTAPAGYYNGYATPLPPSGYQPQPAYPHHGYPQTPTTSMAPPFVAQYPPGEYFPPAPPEVRPPRPRRNSTYGDPALDQVPQQYDDPAYAQRALPPPADVYVPRNDSRPAHPTHASSRSIDRERYEQERRQMPPPELPAKKSEPIHRPSPKKSYTYTDAGHGRSSMDETRDAAPEPVDRRRSRAPEDYDQDAIRALRPVRTREDLPSPAPSSYKADTRELASRPVARQTASYSDPRYVQSVAKSSPPQESTRRRVTEPLTPMDAKVAEAEAYQQKRNSTVSDQLPKEQLKASKSSRAPTRSDAGSNYSHRESHYSTSKDSTAARTARRDSIVIETGGKSRPLSIQMPNGLTVQIGAEKEKEEKRKPKLLEQAPSSTSALSHSSASRSRAATSTHVSSDRGRDRDYQEKSSKRSSHIVESRPPASPIKTTKSSRASSRSRAASDTSGNRHRRQSVVSERIIFRG